MNQPPVAFVADSPDPPLVEIRVNFGVFAGREATPAEIEQLATDLHTRVPEFSIISEQRYEFGDEAEASVHLVRVELDDGDVELRGRVLEIVERWADSCISDRRVEVAEL